MGTMKGRMLAMGAGLAAWSLGLALAAPAGAGAQEAGAATLSLEEALDLARRLNPAYQAVRNDESAASWAVREAWGSFLPRATVSAGARYEDGGAALFGSFTAEDIGFTETPSYYFSSYSASLSMRVSGETFFTVAQRRATRRAVSEEIRASEVRLEAAVKQAYIAGLRARDDVELRRQRLERAEENLTLAEARAAAGVAIPLDVKQARVERGRAQVDALTARSGHATAKLRLLQLLGVDIDEDVTLTTELPVFEPGSTRESLVAMAVARHPALRALDATARAERAAARTARSSYLPTVTASAGWSGFTRQVGSDAFLLAQKTERLEDALDGCQAFNDLSARLADPYAPSDCSRYVLTDQRVDSLRSAVVAGNRAFPFDFQQQPLTVSLGVSLPVFTGFSRQRQVAEASARAEDAEHLLRGERLRLEADVAAAYLRLRTAYEAVQIEETNRAVAGEQLEQARERYRVGLDSFVQLTEAETLKTEADQAYLAAVYTFHEALADLESAVGQPLRPVASADDGGSDR